MNPYRVAERHARRDHGIRCVDPLPKKTPRKLKIRRKRDKFRETLARIDRLLARLGFAA